MARMNKNEDAATLDDVEVVDAPAADEAKAEKAPKRKKAPLPVDANGVETHTTPVGFVKILKEQRGVEVRPQVIYGYTKNSKNFPHSLHTDGRTLVDIAAGLAWWDEKEAKKSAKAEATPSEG